MTEIEVKVPSPYEAVSMLSREEIFQLEALMESPAFGVLCKITRIQASMDLRRLVEATEKELPVIRGQIRGVLMIPALVKNQEVMARAIREKDAAEAKKPKRPSTR